MRRRYKPFPLLEGEQALAVDPTIHAAVKASAGTGKTQVLTGRVLNLLLSGARPETILCITFTKAAAAEMANRISAQLAAWVRLPEQDLNKDLFALRQPDTPVIKERARRLFATVLEAPGGLRIQTIHSFAQTLLAAFPAEAGIAPGFQPLEGRAEQELARTTLANLLSEAEANGNSRLLEDVQRLSLRLGEGSAVDYLMRCAKAQEALAGLGAADMIEPRLRAMIGLPEGAVDQFLAEQCADDRFDCALLRKIAETNRIWGTQRGLGFADAIADWFALPPSERGQALGTLRKIVLTGDGTLRVSTGQRKAHRDYDDHAARLATTISELLQIQNGARLACDMAAGLRAGQAFADAYLRAKRSAGVADFDDLIRWSKRLLAQPGMGDWVRYKLDQRTDHILVDEAQDTNAAQWDIVTALAEEFFSGSAQTDGRTRTLFMVGDFKQAIYGFQGTDPREFDRMRADTARRVEGISGEDSSAEFRDLSISASFRSAQAILDAVDATIGEVGFAAMGLPAPPERHVAFHSARPGIVELWQPFAVEAAGDDGAGEEGWLDEDVRQFADRIAEQVSDWLDQAPVLDTTKRPLTPGDILILVRSRGELASLIVARLFAARVPVAGIDRLFLSKPFAVRDLLAAVTFAVQPLDDLNLASLLVSPLIGWDQQQLFDLAFGRGRTPLWRALRERAAEREDFVAAHALLSQLLRIADYAAPSRFLETILSGPLDGRRKLYHRLGLAARDPIDELMSAALEFESHEIPSLDRFVAWFARGDVEIQRDASERANAVRVMTVHGAKGLEAPFVILADATSDPSSLGRRNGPIDLKVDGQKVPVIRPRKAELVEPFASVDALDLERELEEHLRLLYVGMTRASERLVVAGIAPARGVPEASWYKRVGDGLASLGAIGEPHDRWGNIVRYVGDVPARALQPRRTSTGLTAPAVPQWAREPAPEEERPPRPLAPSAIATDHEALPPPSAEMRAAAQRGTLIHQLLDRLVPVAVEDRAHAASRWLEQTARTADPAFREDILSHVCAILSDPRFAALFGPGSLGEAPLAATLPDGRVIAGTVDRLLVEEGRVSVIDFKTGRVPADEQSVPAGHLAQMRAYADALRVIFPGREVRAALLYTAGPILIEVSA
ncbi:MAG: double-strand break repair helicase AddA [Sphingomicrobium sp.]